VREPKSSAPRRTSAPRAFERKGRREGGLPPNPTRPCVTGRERSDDSTTCLAARYYASTV
jgi:hypothetical protein